MRKKNKFGGLPSIIISAAAVFLCPTISTRGKYKPLRPVFAFVPIRFNGRLEVQHGTLLTREKNIIKREINLPDLNSYISVFLCLAGRENALE